MIALKRKPSIAHAVISYDIHTACAVPIPQADIIIHNNSLVGGCNATWPACSAYLIIMVLQGIINISVNITWSRSNTALSNDHDRVKICGLSKSQPTFISIL